MSGVAMTKQPASAGTCTVTMKSIPVVSRLHSNKKIVYRSVEGTVAEKRMASVKEKRSAEGMSHMTR